MENDIQRILIGTEEIRRGLRRVAAEIAADYSGTDLTVVSVLKGGCIFAADLIRCLPIPLELAFVTARSYGDRTVPGPLELHSVPSTDELAGRRLLLVDDILDTGRTLSALGPELLRRGAGEVRSCVFLDKPARRQVPFEPDYRCFEVEDEFVVGYGLDHAGRYRNLPYVAALRPELLTSTRTP